MFDHLLGKAARVHISDPWELGNERAWEPIECEIIAARIQDLRESLLLRLRHPLTYKDTLCEYVVASPRFTGTSFTQLAPGHSVASNLTRTPIERATGEDPCDTSWWRGGLVIIGNVSFEA